MTNTNKKPADENRIAISAVEVNVDKDEVVRLAIEGLSKKQIEKKLAKQVEKKLLKNIEYELDSHMRTVAREFVEERWSAKVLKDNIKQEIADRVLEKVTKKWQRTAFKDVLKGDEFWFNDRIWEDMLDEMFKDWLKEHKLSFKFEPAKKRRGSKK